MKNGKENKYIISALRVILFVGGVLLGASLSALLFRTYPDIAEGTTRLVSILVCALLLGLFLMFSARPFAFLFGATAGKLKEAVKTKKPEEIVGYALGIALGLILSFAVYIVLAAFVPIRPLNIALTILAALLFSVVGALCCARFFTLESSAEEKEEGEEKELPSDGGYILTSAAFSHPKAALIAGEWLSGKMFVLEESVALFAEAGDEEAGRAVKAYAALSDKIKTVSYSKKGDEIADITAYASAKRLAVITASEKESESYEGKVKVLCLSSL